MRRFKPTVVIGIWLIAGIAGCQPGQYTAKRHAPGYQPPPSQSQRTIVFRAKVSALPSGPLTEGKGADDVVEVVLPGRVYERPLKVEPVTKRDDADRSAPEKASASDFSAFRSGDPEWLRENFTEDDYPRIKGLVEDVNTRKRNQALFKGYDRKAIVARCTYKEYVLMLVQYDDARDQGIVETYQKVKGDWKRTMAISGDDTVVVLQSAFRSGEFVEQKK